MYDLISMYSSYSSYNTWIWIYNFTDYNASIEQTHPLWVFAVFTQSCTIGQGSKIMAIQPSRWWAHFALNPLKYSDFFNSHSVNDWNVPQIFQIYFFRRRYAAMPCNFLGDWLPISRMFGRWICEISNQWNICFIEHAVWMILNATNIDEWPDPEPSNIFQVTSNGLVGFFRQDEWQLLKRF